MKDSLCTSCSGETAVAGVKWAGKYSGEQKGGWTTGNSYSTTIRPEHEKQSWKKKAGKMVDQPSHWWRRIQKIKRKQDVLKVNERCEDEGLIAHLQVVIWCWHVIGVLQKLGHVRHDRLFIRVANINIWGERKRENVSLEPECHCVSIWCIFLHVQYIRLQVFLLHNQRFGFYYPAKWTVHFIIQKMTQILVWNTCNVQSASPWGSRRRGMWSSCSARWNASSRFSWLLLDWTSERSTSWGLREDRTARKTSPLLQLDLKSFTLTEQWTLERTTQTPQEQILTPVTLQML